MRSLALAALLLLIPNLSRASEEPPPPTEAPSAPSDGTTVIAAPGSPGVTVVAPTAQGGTVTAQGCQSVTVAGSPVVVAPGAPCPYQPYQPQPQIIYIEREAKPRFRRDSGRSAAIALSAVALGLGSVITLVRYANERDNYTCSYSSYGYGGGSCKENKAFGELALYGAAMTVFPAIPRLVVGDVKGAAWFSLGIASSVALGAIVDSSDRGDRPGTAFFLVGYGVAAALGIIELATTPHREDLEPKKSSSASGIDGVAPIPLSDARGTHGGAFSMLGHF